MIDRQPGGRAGDRVPSGQSGQAPTARTRQSRGHSHHDGSETVKNARSEATSRPASYAPTTTSNVKQLVASSRFHDDALCQLLDAARLNLIGGEAKKALNRAARARVTELKDMKARGEQEEAGSHALKRHHRKKSKDPKEAQNRQNRKSEGRRSERAETPERRDMAEAEVVQPVTPPQWAQDVSAFSRPHGARADPQIMSRLEAFDARFSELEHRKQQREFADRNPGPAPGHEYVGDMLDELIYNELGPESGNLMGFHGAMYQGVPQIGSNTTGQVPGPQLNSQAYRSETPPRQQNSRMGASIHTMPPTVYSQQPHLARSNGAGGQYLGSSGGGDMTWGSDVELPQAGDSVPPPMQGGPTINVQPPTESNIGKSSYRVPSGPTYSQATPRTPPGMPLPQDIVFEAPGGVIHDPSPRPGMDRDLPPAPAESVLSHRQSPVPGTGSMETQAPPRTPREQLFQRVSPTDNGNGGQSGTYVTPPQGAQPLTAGRDRIHVTDSMPTDERVDPWNLVTQKLYSWALVWEEETFVRAMERMSLGSQIEEFSLTIFMTMTYKR